MSAPTANSTPPPPRRQRARSSVLAQGAGAVWLTGSAVTIAVAMIVGLLVLVIVLGGRTFWPRPLSQIVAIDGKTYLGEVVETETYRPGEDVLSRMPPDKREHVEQTIREHNGEAERRRYRTGNYKETGFAFVWISDFEILEEARPEWAVIFEREQWGNLYGVPEKFIVLPEKGAKSGADSGLVATEPAEVWAAFLKYHDDARDRLAKRKKREAKESSAADQREIDELNAENDRYRIVVKISDGRLVEVKLADVVRAYPANRLSFWNKLGIYFSRWWEFVSTPPREANTEGGVFPAIWGTVTMTLIMAMLVTPFGVLAALYLREYAKSGWVISTVRIAVRNLAGVPSIVFGIFGLGFFCYFLGGAVDSVFYADRLPNPTYKTGGLLWASLTLALLTLPVVIVATEEALASVPNSMREGSYACGASKWQTIWRVVLPRAMPGILTGMILAVARGAGEVAPLMIVGATHSTPEHPVDFTDWSGDFGVIPTGPVHPERSFMHLGYHIYYVGFQSRDSEAARPLVFTTALLLIGIIALLNLTAIWLRSRLRKRFNLSQF